MDGDNETEVLTGSCPTGLRVSPNKLDDQSMLDILFRELSNTSFVGISVSRWC